jgi:hypothetical protein
MTKSGPETQLVAAIRRELLARFPGCFIVKTHGGPFQAMGLPDLLVFYRGKAYGLEVKARRPSESVEAARGRCTAVQKNVLRQLRAAGASADCVLSPAEAIAVVEGAAGFLELGT